MPSSNPVLDAPSSWVFPPALNHTFRDAYITRPRGENDTDPGVEPLIVGAVRNLTLDQRIEEGYVGHKFGEDDVVVRVGDVLGIRWNKDEEEQEHNGVSNGGNRTLTLNCVLCSRGQQTESIFEACDNYTDSAHLSFPFDTTTLIPSPSSSSSSSKKAANYTLPSASRYFDIPASACGICMLTLHDSEGYTEYDYSIPFPVQQAQRYPGFFFDELNPTGVSDPSITHTPDTSLGNPQIVESDEPNVGMIVGVVVGVLLGTTLIGVLCLCLWRKKRKTAKVVASEASSTVGGRTGLREEEARREQAAVELTRMRRIGGVVRRPDIGPGEEAPPAYHEAIRDQTVVERYG